MQITPRLLLHHLYRTPLTSEPHINAVPVHLDGNAIHTILLRNDLRCGEAVEDSLDRCAAVVEGDAAKFARIHELNTLTKLAVAELPAMRHAEGRTRRLEPYNAVDAEDGRKIFAPVRQIGNKVEVILGEHVATEFTLCTRSVPS